MGETVSRSHAVELRSLGLMLRVWGTRKGLWEKAEVCRSDRPLGFSAEKRSKGKTWAGEMAQWGSTVDHLDNSPEGPVQELKSQEQSAGLREVFAQLFKKLFIYF